MSFDDQMGSLFSSRLAEEELIDEISSSSEDESLAELLVMDALAPWRAANPSSSFANALETRLIEHATARAAHAENYPIALRRASLSSGLGNAVQEVLPAPARRSYATHRRALVNARSQATRRNVAVRFWLVAAAALFLVITEAGIFPSGVQAPSANSPNQHHRIEQPSGASIVSPRTELILTFADADEYLAALNVDLSQQVSDTIYVIDLLAFQRDVLTADAALGTHFFGTEQYAFDVRSMELKARGRVELMRSLPRLSWADRLLTTKTLQILGASTPHISRVIITRGTGMAPSAKALDIQGSGFQQGAIVLVNGKQIGPALSSSSAKLRIELDPDFDRSSGMLIGVSNPDGTAVEARVDVTTA